MDITHYESMFDVMKDVSERLWDAGLYLIQVTCEILVESTTRLFTASLEISILGVASRRNSKGYNILCNYLLLREISISSFCHCDIGGAKKCASVLVHNIPPSGSVQEEINGKVRRKLDSILKVNERCLEECDTPGQG